MLSKPHGRHHAHLQAGDVWVMQAEPSLVAGTSRQLGLAAPTAGGQLGRDSHAFSSAA